MERPEENYCNSSTSALRITFFCDKNSHGSLTPFLKEVKKVKLFFFQLKQLILQMFTVMVLKMKIFKRIIWQTILNTPCKYLEPFLCKYREEEI